LYFLHTTLDVLNLPRAVWLLGFISLATDAASETIYPLLPFFLTRVLGAGAVSLGVVEGAAEAANSLLKIWSGRTTDRARQARPLVLLGYGLSSSVRPLIALATGWVQVLSVRVADRVGKGIRGAPRDALLASWASATNRGKVYGFHRAMDHAGAIVGPLLASAFLYFYPDRYRTLFALTIVPGVIAVGLIFLVAEPERRPPAPTGAPGARGVLPAAFTRFMLVLALFTLGNSTDAFLLLRLTDAAGSARFIPLMWAALHVVKASVSVAAGSWSDRVGRRVVIAIGWIVYAAVYAGFASTASLTMLLVWFLVYGCYFGFAEGTEKALVADLAPIEQRGLAFGIYNAVQGLGALAASVLFGVIWSSFGAPAAFATGAGLAIAATALLFTIDGRAASA
jgi:MFS family permease